MIDYIIIGGSFAVAAIGFFWRRSALKSIAKSDGAPTKKQKRLKTISLMLMIASLYVLVVKLVTLLFGKGEKKEITVSIWAPRIEWRGYSISTTVIYTWCVMAALILIALILRIFVVSRFKEVPTRAQNVLETMVEYVEQYTKSKTDDLGDGLGAYIFTIAVFMVGCASVELLGLRAPTADITLTFALAFLTFVLINYYGIKRKGVAGRIKSLANPTPVVLPMKIISDCAIPVSMACRLFGNMLGGMIVMDLLYTALGNGAVGIPSVLGLYFNVFHPLIQAFIFVTLTLTFINEATE